MKYSICPSNMIEYVWKDIEHLIKSVVDVSNKDITVESVKMGLLDERQYLVLIIDGDEIIAVVTVERKELDSGLVALYMPITAGSKMHKWFDGCLDFIKQVALQMGATELRGFMSHEGWGGYLRSKDKNWTDVHTVMSLQIGER